MLRTNQKEVIKTMTKKTNKGKKIEIKRGWTDHRLCFWVPFIGYVLVTFKARDKFIFRFNL